jgi:hypothetical protein
MDWLNKRIEVAKEILKQTHYATGSLSKPTIDLKLEDKKIVANLITEYYWDFINSGVQGLERTVKTVPNLQGVLQKFKTPYPNRNMAEALMGKGRDVTGGGAWMSAKGIEDTESIAYAIATSIKKRGIEANEYINIAFSSEALEELNDIIFEEIEIIWQ